MTDTQPAAHPTALADHLRMLIAGANGAARGAFDVADGACRHTARQIVYAVAHDAAERVDLRPLLSEIAVESERLSGQAVVLHTALNATDAAVSVVMAPSSEASAEDLHETLNGLSAFQAEALALHEAAEKLRRRLPREFGDPLELDADWPVA